MRARKKLNAIAGKEKPGASQHRVESSYDTKSSHQLAIAMMLSAFS